MIGTRKKRKCNHLNNQRGVQRYKLRCPKGRSEGRNKGRKIKKN